VELELPGPVGERNLYALHPRGRVLMRPASRESLFAQMAAVLATGNTGTLEGMSLPDDLPPAVSAMFGAPGKAPFAAALVDGGPARVATMVETVAALPGPIISVHAARPDAPLAYTLDWLLEEVSTSINTTAAGGNASLMMIG
jgi:RHH-type proline utilization regulon transcriptional repressor/proline dehydrogenase/delta 1-pyrroline-5-carboxylate dehydrogenase